MIREKLHEKKEIFKKLFRYLKIRAYMVIMPPRYMSLMHWHTVK